MISILVLHITLKISCKNLFDRNKIGGKKKKPAPKLNGMSWLIKKLKLSNYLELSLPPVISLTDFVLKYGESLYYQRLLKCFCGLFLLLKWLLCLI